MGDLKSNVCVCVGPWRLGCLTASHALWFSQHDPQWIIQPSTMR